MVDAPSIKFGQIRTNALRFWLNETCRELQGFKSQSLHHDLVLYDTYANSFECEWQQTARYIKHDENWHVPHFCSLGDWSGNITDILTDSRYDGIEFSKFDPKTGQILFRYYTRILLVISEIVTDFTDLANISGISSETNMNKRRKYISPDLVEQFNFINSMFKHKADIRHSNHLHYCNHHLAIHFEDSDTQYSGTSPITIQKPFVNKPDMIVMPKLISLIAIVLNGYNVLNNAFMNDLPTFEIFINAYGISL